MNDDFESKDGNKPDQFAKYFALNSDDYTLAERTEIFKQYTAAGGFVGLMSRGTPDIIQHHVYSQMVDNPPLSDAGNDVMVLLGRRGAMKARTEFKKVFEKILEADDYFSDDSKAEREEAREQERIRQEMLKNGCVAGPPKDDDETAPPDLAAIRAELADLEQTLAPELAENAALLAARFRDFVELAYQDLTEIEAAENGTDA